MIYSWLISSLISVSSAQAPLALNIDVLPALGDTQQLIAVFPGEGVSATMQTYSLENGEWKFLKSYPAVSGYKGFAPDGKKVEGDHKTPTGIYPLGQVWGKAEKLATLMPYRQVTADDKFVDDVNSSQYNSWVHGSTTAKSYENMLRDDGIYDYGMVLNYNMNPAVPGKGSAIFMHIWRSPSKGTEGCVALQKENLLEVLKWLDPAKMPKIVLNPPAH